MEATEALSELRYLELELSNVAEAAAPRVTDPDGAAGLRRIAGQHRRHAGEAAAALEAMGAQEAQPDPHFASHVHATEREVLHAPDTDGIFNGLADAERYDLRLHEHMLAAADVPAEVTELIARQTDVQRETLRFVETRAPAVVPEVGGVRTRVPRGPS